VSVSTHLGPHLFWILSRGAGTTALVLSSISATLGIVAGWALIFLGLSFYFRDQIGRARWKQIHRFTLVAWLAGLVHTIVEGTDAGTVWYVALLIVTTAPVLVLLVVRVARAPQDFGLVDPPPRTAPSAGGAEPAHAAPVDPLPVDSLPADPLPRVQPPRPATLWSRDEPAH
jgi:hypothetical protein